MPSMNKEMGLLPRLGAGLLVASATSGSPLTYSVESVRAGMAGPEEAARRPAAHNADMKQVKVQPHFPSSTFLKGDGGRETGTLTTSSTNVLHGPT